jgi:hypothetical protein
MLLDLIAFHFFLFLSNLTYNLLFILMLLLLDDFILFDLILFYDW